MAADERGATGDEHRTLIPKRHLGRIYRTASIDGKQTGRFPTGGGGTVSRLKSHYIAWAPTTPVISGRNLSRQSPTDQCLKRSRVENLKATAGAAQTSSRPMRTYFMPKFWALATRPARRRLRARVSNSLAS